MCNISRFVQQLQALVEVLLRWHNNRMNFKVFLFFQKVFIPSSKHFSLIYKFKCMELQ